VLSYDGENEPDILALIAASAALTISGVPFMGPIGGARVGYQDGEYMLNPSLEQIAEGELDLVVAGHARRGDDGRIRSQGAFGGRDAGRRDVRPPRASEGDRRDHQARRAGRQGPWELEEPADTSAVKAKLAT
jgi:polyribonucleotide nucleotidyltransferase